MNIFLKSKGFGFHIRQALCIALSISIMLVGFPPIESRAVSYDIGIKMDTLRELKTITLTFERVKDILGEFRIITPSLNKKISEALNELKSIISTLEEIMKLIEQIKAVTTSLERIMDTLKGLNAFTPNLEKTMDILKELKIVKPVSESSLEKILDTIKELKTMTRNIERLRDDIKVLKVTSPSSSAMPSLEQKIIATLAELNSSIPSAINTMAQISPEMTIAQTPSFKPTPPPPTRPVPSYKPTRPPPVEQTPPTYQPPPEVGSTGGFDPMLGALLAVGLGVVVAVAIAAGSKKETTSSTSSGGSSSSGCSSVTYSSCCGSSGGVRSVGCTVSPSCGCPSGTSYYGTISSGTYRGYYQCTCKPMLKMYQSFKTPGSGLTLFNSNLSSGVDLFKTKFEVIGACSGDNSMLTTTLGLQFKGEYSRKNGQFVFSPFIQLQHQRSGGLTEFAENNVSVYTSTLYGMDVLYVPYNLTLSSMIRQSIQSEDSEMLNAVAVQLSLKF